MYLTNIQTDLTELKKNIDLAKTNLAKLDGRNQELLLQLKKNHGLSSIEETNERIQSLTKEIAEEEKRIEKEYAALREEYDW